MEKFYVGLNAKELSSTSLVCINVPFFGFGLGLIVLVAESGYGF